MWHRADEPRQGRVHPMCHLADPGDAPRRPGAQLRAAAHQRRDRLQPRARRDAHLDGRRAAARAGQPRLLGVDLPADPGAAATTSARSPSCSTRPTGGSTPAACATSTHPTCARASELVVDQLARAMGKDPLAFRLEFLKDERVQGRAEEGRRGRRLGQDDAGRHGPGHRGPQGVQGRHRLPRRDRLPPRDGQPQDPRRRSPARASPRRRSSSTPAWWSTRPGLEGADDGRLLRRARAGPDQQPAPEGRPLPRGELGQLLLHAAVEHAAGVRGRDRGLRRASSPAVPARRRSRRPAPRSPAPTPGPPARCRRSSRSTTTSRSRSRSRPSCRPCPQSPTDGLNYTY